MGEGGEYIKKVVEEALDGRFNIAPPNKGQKKVAQVWFTNQDKSKGILADGTRVNTVPKGRPQDGDIGYRLSNGKYMVHRPSLKILSGGVNLGKMHQLLNSNNNTSGLKIVNKSGTVYSVTGLPALSFTNCGLTYDGNHLIVFKLLSLSAIDIHFLSDLEFGDDTVTGTYNLVQITGITVPDPTQIQFSFSISSVREGDSLVPVADIFIGTAEEVLTSPPFGFTNYVSVFSIENIRSTGSFTQTPLVLAETIAGEPITRPGLVANIAKTNRVFRDPDTGAVAALWELGFDSTKQYWTTGTFISPYHEILPNTTYLVTDTRKFRPLDYPEIGTSTAVATGSNQFQAIDTEGSNPELQYILTNYSFNESEVLTQGKTVRGPVMDYSPYGVISSFIRFT